jgi:adenylate kinase
MENKRGKEIIIVFGPPGVGKGTQAALLAERLGYKHISTGQVIRESIVNGSEIGKKVEKIMSTGQLISDDLIIKIIEEFFEKNKHSSGFILDGSPRTVNQAEFLEEFVKVKFPANIKILNLISREEILIERLLKRAEIEHRADDTEEIIKNRLEVYRKQTAPVLSFYKGKHPIININGERTPEEVYKETIKSLE